MVSSMRRVSLLGLVAWSVTAACCATPEAGQAEAPAEAVAQADPVAAAPARIIAAYNEGQLDELEPWVHPEVLRTDSGPPVRGRVPYLDTIRALRSAFPDLRVAPVNARREADAWHIKWRWSGTHRGPLAGWAPTGRKVSHEGRTVYRFKEGLLVAVEVKADASDLARQLGQPAERPPSDQIKEP